MIWRLDYRAHDRFIAPALATAALWRLLAGLIMATLLYFMLNQVYFLFFYGLSDQNGRSLYQEVLSGASPMAMYMLLFSFGLMILATGVSVRLLHRRPMRSLIGPVQVARAHFAAVLGLLALLSLALLLLPPWGMGDALVPNLPVGRWLLLLPLSLLGVLVQVSAEEILFRGYVQQQLAARFRSPLIWMVLPSVLFALGHYLPEVAGDNALMIALWAGLFGILMADLTARSGSLGPAIAVHFWNNVSAIVIISVPDDLSGLALYLTPFSMADEAATRAWLPVDFALMLVAWLTARLAIRR
ncbi:CPBP family intramembrane glutamic endopeptidase [Sulfitobacter aestuarii]|uniref:CPBP family intramembrane glutamic endopeptidase n=1 Tax=Sulfitobacter aestuarii TaxID=2161676 RepID=A0ABW5U3Z3_9RHOB